MKIIFPILLLGISVALFFMVIDPQYKLVQEERGKSAQFEKALQASEDVRRQKNLLIEEDKKIMSRVDANGVSEDEKLKKILPKRIDTIKYILDINHFAQLQNVFLKNIIISTDTKAPADASAKAVVIARQGMFKTTGISFGVSTTYESFLSMLAALERNLQITDVTSISFTSTDTNIYDFSINANVYSSE